MEDSKSTSGGVGIGIPSTSHWPETLQRQVKIFPSGHTTQWWPVIMTIKTTLRRRCDGHNDVIIASCVRWDSFCPIWTKNRDGSKCYILFDFPWHIVVETMHLFRDLKKMREWKLPSIPNIPNIYICGIPSLHVYNLRNGLQPSSRE